MSITASWGADLKNIEKDLIRCGSQAPRALAISLKEAATHSKTFAKREICSVYNIKPAAVAQTLSVKAGALEAELKAQGPMVPLYKGGAPKPGTPRFGKGPVLTISVVKGQRTPFNNAWVAKMKSGHLGVFTRQGKQRLPIKERFTISTPEMLLARRLHDSIPKDAGDFFQKRLMHQIGRILGGTTI
jgi:hypothetical protein